MSSQETGPRESGREALTLLQQEVLRTNSLFFEAATNREQNPGDKTSRQGVFLETLETVAVLNLTPQHAGLAGAVESNGGTHQERDTTGQRGATGRELCPLPGFSLRPPNPAETQLRPSGSQG